MSDKSVPSTDEVPNAHGTAAICLFLGLLLAAVLTISTHPAKTINTSLAAQPTASSASYSTRAAQDASQAGLPPDLFVRQIQVESGFNPNAQSPAGAEGIAQFMPATAAGLGIDPWNPAQALKAAAQLMASYLHHYDGSYALALAAYNCGSGCTNSALSRCGSAWLRCVPLQTQAYIARIEQP
jgi:soluble lytic murein transglycosylase-like protein